MKLRQKLAVTMAAAMMLTAVPMVTMASSTNHVIKPGIILQKDQVYNLDGISIQFKDVQDVEEFFLTLEGAEWVNQTSAEDVQKEVLATVKNAQQSAVDLFNGVLNVFSNTAARETNLTQHEKNVQTAVEFYNARYAAVNALFKEAVTFKTRFENMEVVTTNPGAEVELPCCELEEINPESHMVEECLNEQMVFLTRIIDELKNMCGDLQVVSARSVSDDLNTIVGSGFAVNPDGTWEKTVSVKGHPVTIKYIRQTASTMKVEITGLQDNDKVQLNMPVKITGEEVKVTVDPNGGNTSVSGGTYTVVAAANKNFSLAVATGDDLKHFYNEGQLSKITLNERFLNSFMQKGKPLALRIELQNDEFDFDPNSEVKLESKMGYSFPAETSYQKDEVRFVVDSEDTATAYIIIDPSLVGNSNTRGRIEITGIKVKSNDKDIKLGDLTADIVAVDSAKILADESGKNGYDLRQEVEIKGGAELDKDYTDVVLAKVEKFGATITMKDEKAVDIVAGRENDVEFTVKENVDDVFVGKRTITLSLKDNEGDKKSQFFMINRDVVEGIQDGNRADIKKLITSNDNIVKEVEFTFENEKADFAEKTTDASAYVKAGMVRVNEIKVTFEEKDGNGKALNKNDERDSFKINTKVYVPVGEQNKKSVDIVGELRGEEVKQATAVNVIDPFDIEFKTTTLKVGLQDQAVNTFSIKETAKEMFKKGTMEINFVSGKQGGDGIKLETKGNLEASEGIKKTTLGTLANEQGNKVTFKRQSKDAATLTFKDAVVTVDRTVPEGIYNIELSGSAIDQYDGTYSEDKFLNIGTQNTQDIQETNGLAKVEAVFTIGANTYTVEGIEKEMDATPYIQDGGYTMIPVRYVADALGVKPQNILANGGVVTIFAGNRTVQLTNNSKVATVNGAQIELATKVVIKEGRTYVPVGEIGRILGVQVSWDNATKTATFRN